jgi:hypothetical protein
MISSFWKALSVSPFGTDFEIVTAVVYVLQAVAAAEKYRPEVASVHVSLPGLRGAMLLVKISAITTPIRIMELITILNRCHRFRNSGSTTHPRGPASFSTSGAAKPCVPASSP